MTQCEVKESLARAKEIVAEHGDFVIRQYAQQANAVDSLPYTTNFDEMYRTFVAAIGKPISQHAYWMTLVMLRKKGLLETGKKRLKDKNMLSVQERHKSFVLDEFLIQDSPPDHLPYTEVFEKMFLKFVGAFGGSWRRQTYWKILKNLGKDGRLSRGEVENSQSPSLFDS